MIETTTMSSTIKPINYKDYPECMFAMLSAFAESDEGNELRQAAGSVVFKSTDSNGNTYRNGLLHSYDDQPSHTMYDQKMWHKDGEVHREGGLAAVINNEFSSWYFNGRPHREGDLPAVDGPSRKEWRVNGALHRDGDQPAIIAGDLQEWFVNGRRHREGDRPAIVDGRSQEYWVNGVRHRDGDLPALIYWDCCEWWVNGEFVRRVNL